MLFVINYTSLFFHNCRFETPKTKKNIANDVQTWYQGVELLLPSKRLKALLNMGSSTPKATSHPVLVMRSTTTTESGSCAVAQP
jgi:hypothetical protein